MSYTLYLEAENDTIREKYATHSFFHDGDAGVDLFTVETTTVGMGKATFLNFGIKCKMVGPDGNPCSYFLYPRSSICKVPLMMANHTGIIDAGYRGNIMAPVRYLPFADDRQGTPELGMAYTVPVDTRLFQICAPTLGSINLVVLPTGTHLDETTRGSGGFGSTGA